MPSFAPCLLVLALSLSSAGCGSILGIFGSRAKLELTVPSVPWTDDSHNSFDDPNGLGGLRVVLSGAISDTLAASDFPVPPYRVPGSGTIRVRVSLSQESELVAEREVEWALKSNANTWRLEFDRSPFPSGSLTDPERVENKDPNPGCGWFNCQKVWRVDIDEDARNYDDEVLWLMLWMYDGGCVDVCP